jgi:hypothetical protein
MYRIALSFHAQMFLRYELDASRAAKRTSNVTSIDNTMPGGPK